MARPIWRGSLSFGLVAIPVQLHTAVREHRPKFRLLHAKDKSPIKYQRVCQRDGTPVAWEDLVTGYEYERGRYVILTKEDFKASALEKGRRVQVSDFVPAEAIDDRYFDQPYYLLPDKGGEHAYAVFQKALAEVIDLAERPRQSLKIAGGTRKTASKRAAPRTRKTATKAKTRRKRAA